MTVCCHGVRVVLRGLGIRDLGLIKVVVVVVVVVVYVYVCGVAVVAATAVAAVAVVVVAVADSRRFDWGLIQSQRQG